MKKNRIKRGRNGVSKEEIAKGIELLKKIFLPAQEAWESKGVDYGKISRGSFARCDIAVVGERAWLEKRWEFLEKYDTFPEEVREQADICFPLILKIFEFQSKKEPHPIDISTLFKVFEKRFTKIEIDIALDILLDFMFIRYYIGKLTEEITSTCLIKFTAEIPEDMKTA